MTIEDQIEQLDLTVPEKVIDFYELNRIYFDNYQHLQDSDRISQFIDIKLLYANSLSNKHHLKKLLEVLEDVSALLQKLPDGHWNYNESERHMRFLKGMALSRQKKFKDSYSIFRILIKKILNTTTIKCGTTIQSLEPTIGFLTVFSYSVQYSFLEI